MPISNASRIFCGPAVVLGLLTGGAACAADMGYVLQNEHSRSVAIELHAADRTWPGGDQVYLLDPGEIKAVKISCTPGERICYGAWINGDDRVAFGVGPDNDRTCRNCCSICVGHTMETIDLTP
ncbi:MAG: hypothetical protein L0I29_06665 [Hyphomicrobiales bacterium]|nr:hypothetical protein [Hyphomicrobiales bacterium]